MTYSTRIKIREATVSAMYAALDLHKLIVQAVIKDDDGNIVKEQKLNTFTHIGSPL